MNRPLMIRPDGTVEHATHREAEHIAHHLEGKFKPTGARKARGKKGKNAGLAAPGKPVKQRIAESEHSPQPGSPEYEALRRRVNELQGELSTRDSAVLISVGKRAATQPPLKNCPLLWLTSLT